MDKRRHIVVAVQKDMELDAALLASEFRPWEKGQTQRYRRRIEKKQLVLESKLPRARIPQSTGGPEFIHKDPEHVPEKLRRSMFVGIRESRFVRVPVYTQMYELPIATLKTVAYLTQRISPCKMTKQH